MSPHDKKNTGGSSGRAASPGHDRNAARAGELRTLTRCLGVMALALGVLAFNAEDVWPMLFSH